MFRHVLTPVCVLVVFVHALVAALHGGPGHGFYGMKVEPGDMHSHGTDAKQPAPDRSPSGPAGNVVLYAAESPHQHGVHMHSPTDHGYSLPRLDQFEMDGVGWLEAALSIVIQPGVPSMVATDSSPPPKLPSLGSTFLRGPPLC